MSGETPKQVAARRLRGMVPLACDALEALLTDRSDKTAHLRLPAVQMVLETLERDPDKPESTKEPLTALADVSEKLRLIKQAERRMR